MFQCIYCGREFNKKNCLVVHQKACKSNPNRVQGKNGWSNPDHKLSEETLNVMREKSTGRKHSQETKDKISKIRRDYLKDNPDKVPYLLNHYSKGESYPERYFTDVFINEGITLTKKHRIYLYELDFCDIKRKVDIEIDGEQHYSDQRIIDSDIRRTEYLNNHGWTVYRIRWSDFQKKTYYEKAMIIEDIKNLLGS